METGIKVHNDPRGREETEWANFWYSHANLWGGQKLLMIGDSNGRKTRSILERMSGKSVDFLGTSSGLHDMLFVSQLQAYFSVIPEHCYESIYIWLGYHSLINEKGSKYEENDYVRFKDDIIALVDVLREYSDKIIICSAFYPVKKEVIKNIFERVWFHLKWLSRIRNERVDVDDYSIIKRKNMILQQVANERKLLYCDINGYMLERCSKYRTRYIHVDRIHYEEKAYPIITKFLLDYKNKLE